MERAQQCLLVGYHHCCIVLHTRGELQIIEDVKTLDFCFSLILFSRPSFVMKCCAVYDTMSSYYVCARLLKDLIVPLISIQAKTEKLQKTDDFFLAAFCQRIKAAERQKPLIFANIFHLNVTQR